MGEAATPRDGEQGLPAPHAAALAMLCDRLPIAEVNWALTGSTAFALQGILDRAHLIRGWISACDPSSRG